MHCTRQHETCSIKLTCTNSMHVFTDIAWFTFINLDWHVFVRFCFYYYLKNTNAWVCFYAHAPAHVKICYANLYTAFTMCKVNIAEGNEPFSSVIYWVTLQNVAFVRSQVEVPRGCPDISLSLYLYIYTYLSVYRSIYLFIYLSIYLYIYIHILYCTWFHLSFGNQEWLTGTVSLGSIVFQVISLLSSSGIAQVTMFEVG